MKTFLEAHLRVLMLSLLLMIIILSGFVLFYSFYASRFLFDYNTSILFIQSVCWLFKNSQTGLNDSQKHN